jgi:long-chain acyl-CoA synthetase
MGVGIGRAGLCGLLSGVSIHAPILRSLLRRAFRPVITDDSRTYRGIDVLVAALHTAGAIRASSSSSTVGVMVPTSGAFPIAALAGWMAGKVVVPLNYLLKQEELQYVIDDCGCDTVLSATQLLEHMGFEPRVRTLLRMDGMDFRAFPEPVWPAGANDDDLGVLL